MNDQVYNIFMDSYQELLNHLKKQYRKGQFEESDLTAFFNKIKKFIPELSDSSPLYLKDYYIFTESIIEKLGDAISFNDSDLFDESLKEIKGETEYILNKY